MPVNKKGGKGFKKMKKLSSQGYREAVFVEISEGQMPARIVRLLGNRNVLCYCNDGVVRICHICGAMKGRVYIEPGDIVIISLRVFIESATDKEKKKINRGDVVGKYPAEQYSYLKKQAGINTNLFQKLETGSTVQLGHLGVDLSGSSILPAELDDGFDFENSSVSGDESVHENGLTTVVQKEEARKEKDIDLDTL
jgi:translation initiation factor 1A